MSVDALTPELLRKIGTEVNGAGEFNAAVLPPEKRLHFQKNYPTSGRRHHHCSVE